jgi:aspartate-semialdehyde dehydrogenase
MSREFRVVVVGATGLVGETLIQVLEERNFPVSELHVLASNRSVGKRVDFKGRSLPVRELAGFDFSKADIGLFSPGAEVSREYAPKAAAAGCIVIDNTSEFRYYDDVPLVVPEVNPHAISAYKNRNIIANPNCSTIQMVTALKPLHDLYRIRRIVVSTYQSTSGAGKAGMDELFNQTKGIFVNQSAEAHRGKFTKQIAFNVIPHIDVFMPGGETKEEWKMVEETKKILDPRIKVMATCVRVPTFIGHGEAVSIECERPIPENAARNLLREAPGVSVVDSRADGGYVTPVECAGEDAVYVSRIRKDSSVENGLAMWIVSDNLRKGAALNAVQIAEVLARKFLRKAA